MNEKMIKTTISLGKADAFYADKEKGTSVWFPFTGGDGPCAVDATKFRVEMDHENQRYRLIELKPGEPVQKTNISDGLITIPN